MARTFCLGMVAAGCCLLAGAAAGPKKSDRLDGKAAAMMSKKNNEFAFALYQQLAKNAKSGDNIFFSPHSIRTALAMTYAGARGKTAEEMAEVLRFDTDQEKFHPAFTEWSRQIVTPKKEFKGEFRVANAIWTDQRIQVRDSFKELMSRHYAAGLRAANFSGAPEAERKRINAWAEDNTKGKIKDLLPEGTITSNTLSVLANAVYFQAKWLVAFEKQETKTGRFFVTKAKAVDIPMMHLQAQLRYAKLNSVEIVELPYSGSDYSMVLLLPTSPDKFAAVEKHLPKMDEWLAHLADYKVDLYLPKWRMGSFFALADTLQTMGIKQAFSAADLSGMDSAGGRISQVYHKAILEVDETGTTAAAATAVTRAKSEPLRATVKYDRPFLLAIKRASGDSVIFFGRVSQPHN